MCARAHDRVCKYECDLPCLSRGLPRAKKSMFITLRGPACCSKFKNLPFIEEFLSKDSLPPASPAPGDLRGNVFKSSQSIKCGLEYSPNFGKFARSSKWIVSSFSQASPIPRSTKRHLVFCLYSKPKHTTCCQHFEKSESASSTTVTPLACTPNHGLIPFPNPPRKHDTHSIQTHLCSRFREACSSSESTCFITL